MHVSLGTKQHLKRFKILVERKKNQTCSVSCLLSYDPGPFAFEVVSMLSLSLSLSLSSAVSYDFIHTTYYVFITTPHSTSALSVFVLIHTLAAFYDPLFTMIQSSGRQLPKSGSTLHLVPALNTSSTSSKRNKKYWVLFHPDHREN